MPSSRTDAVDLQKRITGAYFSLRLGMGLLAAILPPTLWLGGWFGDHEPLRCSMSSYYYSPVMRDKFVGILCAIGVFLYLYKGFSRQENWALNFAGALAVGIAMVPTTPSCAGGYTLHSVFALFFFLSISYVCVFCASDTLSMIRNTRTAERLRDLYRTYGVVMLASPLIAVWISRTLQPGSEHSKLFFIESIAVLTFAAYWLTKSWELRVTDADLLGAEGKVMLAPKAPKSVKRAPGRLVQIEPESDDVIMPPPDALSTDKRQVSSKVVS